MISIACVDDDKTVIDTVLGFIDRYKKEKGVSLKATGFSNGFSLLDAKSLYDIVLLDVDMPGINGMDVAKYIRRSNDTCVIGFITNFARFAIAGYDVNATCFLLKPINYADFAFQFEKMLGIAENRRGGSIVVKENYAVRSIDVSQIQYVELLRKKVLYHLVTGDVEVWDSMKNTVNRLSEFSFALCNSCFLVNLKYVEKIKGNSVIVGGKELAISRSKHKNFLEAFAFYKG